ncbi:hypothetical protein Tco_0153453 [Tanacetum coccineum]
MVGGMQRNLSLPDGVVRKAGLAIKEPETGIFCAMKSLICIDELIYEIESRPNVVQTREIVAKNIDVADGHHRTMKGLASESNLRCIHVKDIIKEVKDYLKSYSSAGMDIS